MRAQRQTYTLFMHGKKLAVCCCALYKCVGVNWVSERASFTCLRFQCVVYSMCRNPRLVRQKLKIVFALLVSAKPCRLFANECVRRSMGNLTKFYDDSIDVLDSLSLFDYLARIFNAPSKCVRLKQIRVWKSQRSSHLFVDI